MLIFAHQSWPVINAFRFMLQNLFEDCCMISVCEILLKQNHLSVLNECIYTNSKKQKYTFFAQVSTQNCLYTVHISWERANVPTQLRPKP